MKRLLWLHNCTKQVSCHRRVRHDINYRCASRRPHGIFLWRIRCHLKGWQVEMSYRAPTIGTTLPFDRKLCNHLNEGIRSLRETKYLTKLFFITQLISWLDFSACYPFFSGLTRKRLVLYPTDRAPLWGTAHCSAQV